MIHGSRQQAGGDGEGGSEAGSDGEGGREAGSDGGSNVESLERALGVVRVEAAAWRGSEKGDV